MLFQLPTSVCHWENTGAGRGTFLYEIAVACVRRLFRCLPDFCHLNVEVANGFVERPDSFSSILPMLGKSTSSDAHFQGFLIALRSSEQTFMTGPSMWLAQFGGYLAVLMAPEMQPTQAASSRFLHLCVFVCVLGGRVVVPGGGYVGLQWQACLSLNLQIPHHLKYHSQGLS